MTIQIQQQLANVIEEIALEDQLPQTGPDSADAALIDAEEIISEVVIRERLIEWLVGFLPSESGGNKGTS